MVCGAVGQGLGDGSEGICRQGQSGQPQFGGQGLGVLVNLPGGIPAADCLAGSGRDRTLAVTLGLPSRSPPIQEPKRMGQASMGSSRPVCFFSEAEMRRSSLGREDHSDCSTMCSPPRASAGRGGAGGGGGGVAPTPGWWARTHGQIMAKLFTWQPVTAAMTHGPHKAGQQRQTAVQLGRKQPGGPAHRPAASACGGAAHLSARAR